MAIYTKNEWEPGTSITQEKLNRMENGIYNAFRDRGKIELLENNILLSELTIPGIYVLAAKSNENTFNYEDWPEGLSNYNAILEVLLASQTIIQRLTPLTTSTTNNTYFIRYKIGTSNWVGWKNLKEEINSFLIDKDYIFKGYKILSPGTSLDNITQTGFYYIPLKTELYNIYYNLPGGTVLESHNKILEVFQLSETGATIMQRLTDMQTSDQYIRYSIQPSGQSRRFNDWTKVIDIDSTLKVANRPADAKAVGDKIDLINERINQFPHPDTILNNYGILGISKGIAAETPSKIYPDDFNDDEDYTKNNDINKVLQTGFYFLPGTNSENLNRHYEYKNLPALISNGYKLLEVLKFTNYTIIQRITVPITGEQYIRQIVKVVSDQNDSTYSYSDWINNTIPKIPTQQGTYILKATVSNGEKNLQWVVQ